MKKELLELEKRALEELERAGDASELEKFRVSYLGKKGLVTSFMRQLGRVPPEQRPELGKLGNRIKTNLSRQFEKVSKTLASKRPSGPPIWM